MKGTDTLSVFQPIDVAAWACRSALTLVLRPVVWVPFLVVAGAKLALLFLLIFFHQASVLPLALPLVRLLGGDAATHYPVLFYALPTMFARADLAISALVASIAGGAATLLFARALGYADIPKAWGRAWRSAPTLIPVNILVMGLLFGVAALGKLAPQELVLQNAAVRWGIRGGTLFLFILIQSFVVYTTAWVVLVGHKIGPAFRDSIRVTIRTFLPTALVVAVPALLLFPLSYAGSRVDLVASKFRPEVIVGVLCTEIAVEVLATFLLVGAVTRLFLWRTEGAR
jgi:hypothetical protein